MWWVVSWNVFFDRTLKFFLECKWKLSPQGNAMTACPPLCFAKRILSQNLCFQWRLPFSVLKYIPASHFTVFWHHLTSFPLSSALWITDKKSQTTRAPFLIIWCLPSCKIPPSPPPRSASFLIHKLLLNLGVKHIPLPCILLSRLTQ